MVRSLSEGCSTLQISKILGRDHRTIKSFVANTQQGHKKPCKWIAKGLRRIRHEAPRNPFSSSSALFHTWNPPGGSTSMRCSVLRDMVQGRGWKPTTSEQDTEAETSRMGPEISEGRVFRGFVDWWDESDRTRPRWTGRGWSSNGHSSTAEQEVGAGMGRCSRWARWTFAGGKWRPTARFYKTLPSSSGTGASLHLPRRLRFLCKTLHHMRPSSPLRGWSKGLQNEELMARPWSSSDFNPTDNCWFSKGGGSVFLWLYIVDCPCLDKYIKHKHLQAHAWLGFCHFN